MLVLFMCMLNIFYACALYIQALFISILNIIYARAFCVHVEPAFYACAFYVHVALNHVFIALCIIAGAFMHIIIHAVVSHCSMSVPSFRFLCIPVALNHCLPPLSVLA